jgi:signal transduction histidine kinase
MIKILLMEDDLNLCQSIQQALKKEGYSVDCCNDGESAMIYALNTDYGYDLAIVDRMLPIIDGLTIIKAMRRKQIQIPVIIITGMSALDDRVDGLDSGADDYLIKPFHIRELMARVRAFQSKPDTRTDLDTLIRIAEKSIEIQYPAEQTTVSPITEQGGYGKITGNDHDSYYVIPSNIHTKAGNIYSLVLFYEPSSISSLLLQQLPAYATIWLLAFILILLASRFLLHRAFEPTEQVLQSHKDFIAAASHELKSPLAVIMANIESIQNSEIKEPQTQNSLKVIDAECIRMSRLVRDMLLLASSDADKWTIHTQEVNIDTLLIMLYEAYEPICRKKSIHLDLNLDAESYPQIYTDQERVFQVLSIFLDNAVSYSKENSNIEILTSQTSKEFTFLVVDHGCGIAEKDKPFIFDRFYCADKSRTNKAHFGLGLSIAKELAKMLSGKIGFSDTSGGGTTFFLTLPIK